MTWQQAERDPLDGAVALKRVGHGKLQLTVHNGADESSIVVSEFNAARVLGGLLIMLDVPMSASVGSVAKRIKFFDQASDTAVSFVFPVSHET